MDGLKARITTAICVIAGTTLAVGAGLVWFAFRNSAAPPHPSLLWPLILIVGSLAFLFGAARKPDRFILCLSLGLLAGFFYIASQKHYGCCGQELLDKEPASTSLWPRRMP